jgi:hypothetical protein
VQADELLGFTALAVLAVQHDSPAPLGADWLAHVTWDTLHYRGPRAHSGAVLVPAVLHQLDVALAAPLLTGRL